MLYRSFQELAASIGLPAPITERVWVDSIGEQPIWTYHEIRSRKLEAAIGSDFVGIELELVPVGSAKELADNICLATEGQVICMEDSSLMFPCDRWGNRLQQPDQYKTYGPVAVPVYAEFGFEIVTDYGDLTQILRICEQIVGAVDNQAWSHDTECCGLHIHLSRNGASQLELARLVIFWNSEINREFLNCFTRRYPGQHCFPRDVKDTKPADLDLQWGDRHELVNLCNQHTVELRGFRGTIVRETLLACVQLAAATWRFARDEALCFRPGPLR